MGLLRSFLSLLILGAFLFACKKEPTTWDQQVEAPLLEGKLGIGDLLPPAKLEEVNGQALRLVHEDTLFQLPLDSILKMPDTTLLKSYVNNFGSFVASPGQKLIDNSDEHEFQLNGVELRESVIHDGKLEYEAKNSLGERVLFVYRVPSATKNGDVLEIEGSVPAGTSSDPSVVSGTRDLSGYHLDLTGKNGGQVNKLDTEVEVRIDPDGEDVSVEPGDSVVIRNSFKSLRPAFARGYFGQSSLSSGYQEQELSLFDKVKSGLLDIDSVALRFILDNGIGMDARVKFPLIRAIGREEVDLDHSLTQDPINITRAQYQNNTMKHSEHEELLTPMNSNVDEFLEALPRRFAHEMEILTNPLGDVSNGNDILLRGHDVQLRMRMDLPLRFRAEDLTLVDTLDWKMGNEEKGRVKEGSFFLNVENGFPFAVELSLEFLDGKEGLRLFEDRLVPAAPMDASWEASGKRVKRLRFPLSEGDLERMREADRAVVRARFNTSKHAPHIGLFSHYELAFQLTGDLRYRQHLE